jgi:DUF4097 and DUF4098 domain-containing protein YvlB
MNSRSLMIHSLAIAALVTSCGRTVEQQSRAHYEKTFPADAIRRVEVRQVAGSINVEAAGNDKIEMTADIKAYGQAPDKTKDYDGYFTTEISGDTLIIDTTHGRKNRHFFFFGNRDVRADYELRVPANVELELQTVSGRIATRGIAGETTATTVNGELDLEATGTSELSANAVNGRIEARFLSDFHGARFKTINGRVIATLPSSASFMGDFTQVNGDFEAAFPLNIHSHPGSRRVSGEVNGGRYALKITTINGDIKIDNEPAPPARPAVPEVPAAPAAAAPPRT